MYNFINDEYKITFKVPAILQEFMELAEAADKNNDLGNYLVYADEIDVLAKDCCRTNEITDEMWMILLARYCQ